MRKILFVAGVSLLAFSTAAFAQNSQAQAQKPPATAETPQGPVRTERTVFDSWVVTCQEVVGDPKSRRCSAALQIVEEQSKRVAFIWAIGKNAAGAPTAVFTTPTGLSLANGLELRIGKGQARKMAFTSCDAASCEAVMPLDEGVLKEARTGEDASATITMKDGRTVRFGIVNKGFEKALAAIRN